MWTRVKNDTDQAESYRVSHSADGYGTRYSHTYQKGYYFHQWTKLEEPLLRQIFSRYRDAGATRALDFACGTGRILRVLEDYFDRSTGVDVSESMLAVARQACKRAVIIGQDITDQPLDIEVDIATAFRFFLNAEPSLRKGALKAIHKCLRPGGVLIANVHVNSSSMLGVVYRMRNSMMRRTSAKVLGYAEFCETVKEAGFSIRETYWYSFLPRPGWLAGEVCGRLLIPFEKSWKSLRLPETWAQCFLICAVKE
jgi:SAM-dependent methyltransferase